MIGSSKGNQYEDSFDATLASYKPSETDEKPVINTPKEDSGKLITDWEDVGMYKGTMTELYKLSPKELKEYYKELEDRITTKINK